MAGNSYGTLFRITTFGESHGEALGGIIDGCPSGIALDFEAIQFEMSRRKPGQSSISTQRNETEEFEILSGVFDGISLGTPIAIIVRNTDQRSSDYNDLKNVFRPSHDDFTYQEKYGFRDHRGGGRQSARETVARVLAGSIAKMILNEFGVKIQAAVSGIGGVEKSNYDELNFEYSETNILRCGYKDLYEVNLHIEPIWR
jgi:chorismate synthase